MCAMKIKTEQELLTNKRKEVGKKKKIPVNRLLKYPLEKGKEGLFLFVVL